MKMRNLLIWKWTNNKEVLNGKFVNKLLDMYIQIFWVEPWNEWFVCENCWKLFPINKKNISCCGQVKPFYDKKELLKDFKSWYEKKWFMWIISTNTKNNLLDPIWFNIGWLTSIEKLNQDKLGLWDDELKKLKQNILKTYTNFDLGNTFYIADLWLKEEFRWQKLASSMFYGLMKEIENKNYNNIIVRTTKKSDVPYKWFKKIWFQEVFNYNDEQDRVILVYKK